LREALIDLRFEAPIALDVIDRFVASIADSYGTQADLWEAVLGLSTDGRAAHSGNKIVGRRLEAANGPYVLQCRSTGLTLSRLTPYAEWEDLRNEALRLWEAFLAVSGSLVVTRTAVRYINEIGLPLPFADFDEYLTCAPVVPASLPQSLGGFLSRVIIPDPAKNCTSAVTQAFDGPPAERPDGSSSITVVLDIDVWRIVRLDASQAGDLWEGLDVLREQKNRIFFEYLTEKTVEMYE